MAHPQGPESLWVQTHNASLVGLTNCALWGFSSLSQHLDRFPHFGKVLGQQGSAVVMKNGFRACSAHIFSDEKGGSPCVFRPWKSVNNRELEWYF